MKILHANPVGFFTFAAYMPVPSPSSIPPLPNPILTETREISTSAPTRILPSATTTLFAERVNTREPGVNLTSTPQFPTVIPIRFGDRIWTSGSPLPTQRLELSSAVLNGKIYAAGGSHVKGLTYARMEVYDPLTNE